MKRYSNPWSRKIDYVAAIADDEREIARLSDPVFIALIASMTDGELAALKNGYRVDAFWLLADEKLGVERARIMGLSGTEVAQAFVSSEGDVEALDAAAARHDPSVRFEAGERYRNGVALADKLHEMVLCTEEQRVAGLKRAKASLARHRRNQAKYGR